MAFTAADVLRRVSTILSDANSTRWPLLELLDWLNDALREVTLHAPEAISTTVVIELVQGTRQPLDADYASLLRINCNVTATGQTVTARGKIVRPTRKQFLDATKPGWQDNSVLSFGATAHYLVEDDANHRFFYIAPGNDGTGKVEAVVAKRPAAIAEPDDPLDVDSYDDAVELDDMYLTAVVDFVLSKAFAKDVRVAGGAQRSEIHYQRFAQALGIRQANEKRVNPYTAETQP